MLIMRRPVYFSMSSFVKYCILTMVGSEVTEDVNVNDIVGLVHDVSSLYLNEKFSDIMLVLNGEKIYAHKVILAARSEYFETLLYDNGKQVPNQTEIKINDISPEAFRQVLKYIYTGKIIISPSKINLTLDMMSLAQQYSLNDLDSTIIKKSKQILNLENVCPILNGANLYNLDDLRDACHVLLDKHASEIVANDNCFNELLQISMVNLLKRDSFIALEIEIFKRVAKWCETNNDVDNLVVKCVRLSQLTVVEIVSIVWPSRLLECEALLSAIAEIVKVKPKTTSTRARLLVDENLATPEQKATVISGTSSSGPSSLLLSGNRNNAKYVYHLIGSGNILIKLAVKSFINHIYTKLYDSDERYYCYYIEVSTDQENWKRIIDYTHYPCKSYQNLFFSPEAVQYIRIVGTRNSYNENVFHIVFFETYYKSTIPRIVNGIISPTENVATLEKKAAVLNNKLILLDHNEDGKKGYIYHLIGSGNITVQLAQPYLISSMRFRLWDGDDRHYKYYVESSLNNTDWDMIVDYRNENRKSWQIIRFTERPVVFIRITGTHNSYNENFHLFYFECPAMVEK